MLTLNSARKLKTAGLSWTPALHDFFAVPDRGMDDKVFVISDVNVDIDRMFGRQVVAFHGAVEWALDYELIAEVIWLPTEQQLRELLHKRLQGEVRLVSSPANSICEIHYQGNRLFFEAPDANEAYAAALLYIVQHEAPTPRP